MSLGTKESVLSRSEIAGTILERRSENFYDCGIAKVSIPIRSDRSPVQSSIFRRTGPGSAEPQLGGNEPFQKRQIRY